MSILENIYSIKESHNSTLIGSSLFLGWAADLLFFGKALGLSLPLYSALLLTIFWISTKRTGKALSRQNLWLIGPILTFSFFAMLRANPTLTLINVGLTTFFLLLYAVYSRSGSLMTPKILRLGMLPLQAAGRTLTLPGPVLYDSVQEDMLGENGRKNLLHIIGGIIMAAPILLVFGLLLTSADALFQQVLGNLLAKIIPDNFAVIIQRPLFIAILGWLTLGWVSLGLSKNGGDQMPRSWPEKIVDGLTRLIQISITQTTTILTLCNLLFGLFVSVQFAYLFGGLQFMTESDLSGGYASYARQGFFELVTVAILTLLLLQTLNRFTRKTTRGEAFLFNGASSLLIGFVLIMLVSAFDRMWLYEWQYGFTELRLFTHIFMVWMGVALVWYMITLWHQPERFAIGALIAMLGFCFTLNLINPERVIVQRNLARFELIGHIDLGYLSDLSADAIPHLTEVLQHPQIAQYEGPLNATACSGHDYITSSRLSNEIGGSSLSSGPSSSSICIEVGRAADLETVLNQRLEAYASDPRPWPSFHIGHARAERELTHFFDTLGP